MGFIKVSSHTITELIRDTFEQDPARYHSVAVSAEGNYKYLNGGATPSSTSPVEWATQQQALMVEDIYSGNSGWMSPPMGLNQGA